MKKLIFLVFGCLLLILNGITLQFPVCFFGYADEIKSKILIYAKQGYIVKTNTGGEGWKHYIVVMEKY